MAIESKIYTILSGSAQVTGVVSTNIWPVYPAQDSTFPYLAYTRVGTETQMSLSGPGPLKNYSIQLDYWCINFDTTADLASKIVTLLDGYHDSDIQGIFLSEQSVEQDENLLYHGFQIFNVFTTL